jgi:RNA polymerase sigma-70 factor, ECF subfamily
MTAVSQLRTANLESAGAEESADPGKRLRMDEATFRNCYERTGSPLFAYLLRVSKDRALAEDLLQETYCRLLTAKLPPMDDAQLRSYLFRIATNLLRDRWRHPKEGELADSAFNLFSANPEIDRQLATRQAFDQLKPRERQMLWLAYVEGSSHKEIARAMGVRTASVRLLLFRARRKFAELIGRDHRLQSEDLK